MTIVPLLLDQRPAYLGADAGLESLLLVPTVDGTLVGEIARALARVTSHRPSVLPAFDADVTYESRLRVACPEARALASTSAMWSMLASLEPSDSVLLVSPSRYPSAGIDFGALCMTISGDHGMARHLLGFEATSLGTKEFVQSGDDGRVRRIQRYFAPVTWPFSVGVIASLVPVACLHAVPPMLINSLDELRGALSACGIPSCDVPFHGESLDLADEGSALMLMERRVMAASSRQQRMVASAADASLRSPAATIDPSARFVGPVVVHDRAVVEANALVIGPAVIGSGARVARWAVVAQCLILPGAIVAETVTVRHRVVATAPAGGTGGAQRRHVPAAPRQRDAQAEKTSYLAVRRVLEPIVAAAALLVLAPLLIVIAVLTKLGSRGPCLYGDRREGRYGAPFTCWKFRTMRTNAAAMQRDLASQQQMDGPQFKMIHDPRVTPVGQWLRRLNVDELPQLWNVVRGEMSLVGPRPSPFRENQICVPWRNGRLSVNPGITGLWQVCRHDRLLGDFHQWIHYDLLYARNVSLRVDLRILIATIVTLGGRHPVPLSRIIGSGADSRDGAPPPARARRVEGRRRRSGRSYTA